MNSDLPTDCFKTLSEPSREVLHKDRKSKFYGYAFPVAKEEEVKPILTALRKKHHTANHVCYAWQLGMDTKKYRVNDDGEPNNAAGMPIYGQIQSFEVTGVLVAVVRIFGGTKLGVGGLINAYRTTAQMALQAAHIVQKTIQQRVTINFAYEQMNKVMQLIKSQEIQIIHQELNNQCLLTLSIRKKNVDKISNILNGMQGVSIKKM